MRLNQEVVFSTKPEEILIQLLQEEIDLHSPVNNLDYYPYQGA